MSILCHYKNSLLTAILMEFYEISQKLFSSRINSLLIVRRILFTMAEKISTMINHTIAIALAIRKIFPFRL
jgi:hypothetical protein